MLFSSYEFLFAFLPLTLTGYFLVARWGREPAIAWLVMSSLFFYGWWNPVYLLLIVGSMIVIWRRPVDSSSYSRMVCSSTMSWKRTTPE